MFEFIWKAEISLLVSELMTYKGRRKFPVALISSFFSFFFFFLGGGGGGVAHKINLIAA